jgi:O-antigen/teichoic acid export membrane protein
VVLPMLLGLAILGDPILRVWMGGRYEQGLVLAILALGCLVPLLQRPMATILMGLNRHGRVAAFNLAAAVAGVSLGFLNAWWLDAKLVGAALAVALPFTAITGSLLAVYGCRSLGIPLGTYLRETLLVPILCMLPFAAVLGLCRVALADHPALALAAGSAGGAAVLAPLYWVLVVPAGVRDGVRAAARRFTRLERSAA